jgi:membrane fusion protein (multidrug efflux system)
VRQALGGLDAARAGRDALADQVERLRRLSGSGAVSSSQLLAVESQFNGSEAQVRQLEALLGQARQRKGDSVVRAPVAGVVGQTFLDVGDLAAPQIPICTVVAMDRLRVALRVPEADLPSLAVGQPVEVRIAAGDGTPINASVSRIGPVLERVSRTASLEIDLDNADHALRPGLLIRARVLVERREGVPLVLKSVLTVTAERRDGVSLYRAVVSEGGVARERLVRIGLEEGERVEVLEGLAPGELLVIEGQHLLADGDPITAAAPRALASPADGG